MIGVRDVMDQPDVVSDYANEEDVGVSLIECLPNEILSHILSYCDDKSLRNAMLTSHRWFALVNETVGFSVFVGNRFARFRNMAIRVHQPVDVITRLGVKNCSIGELDRDAPEMPPFRYPQTVRSIAFSGPMTSTNLEILLFPLPKLTIHFSTLENVKIPPGLFKSTWLKKFQLTSHEVDPFHYSKEMGKSVMDNLIQLLENINSSQLNTLILDLLHFPEYDTKIAVAILNVLIKHKLTMRTLQCYCQIEINRFSRQRPENRVLSENAFPQLCPPESDLITEKAMEEAVFLKRISYAGAADMQSEVIWNRLIQSQTKLEELFYMNEDRSTSRNAGISCLEANADTLSKVFLHINSVDEHHRTTVFDFNILTKFNRLTHLLLRGQMQQNELKPQIRNIELIPKTVKVLSLRDVYVESEVLTQFQTWLPPNLQKFRLVTTGCIGSLGIEPGTLLELIKIERIQDLEIIRSFNRETWENVKGKDIFEDSLLYRIKTDWRFHGVRDKRGVLHYKNEQMFDLSNFDNVLTANGCPTPNDVCEVVFE